MYRWKYRLNVAGVELHNLIENGEDKETSMKILAQIKKCADDLAPQLHADDVWVKAAIDKIISEAQEEIDDGIHQTDEEFADLVNDVLQEFYDICDECRCWIELPSR